ncbi:Uncharacterised protein [Bordetella pertussis]|nr:Uncharacterised protein [Bordetella pertussis]CPM53715.1 Uncharacterised protein [Bordetella pertussis]
MFQAAPALSSRCSIAICRERSSSSKQAPCWAYSAPLRRNPTIRGWPRNSYGCDSASRTSGATSRAERGSRSGAHTMNESEEWRATWK